ncbi:OmpA family protein [Pedobacter sp. HMF7647]|uniref:OmpA family protein n=1 Tax=Hufsiella arboris TaxID=2695275 RepID=A0A7K1YFM5_9SPHI|nr:OmpA family protein [Hufsiella arboris]
MSLPPPPPPQPPVAQGPPPSPKPKPGVVFQLEKVYYDFDKYNIRPDAAKALDELAAYLRQDPEQRVELRAHTDSRGPAIYNQWLSDERAKSAKKYLINKGIEAARMDTRGFGETQLVNGCSDGVKCTPQQHQMNRRLEVKMLE